MIGFDPTVSVVESRTATSTVYRNADGTHTALISQETVNYRGADGVWRPIDNSVASDSSQAGGLAVNGNSWQTHFGTTAQGLRVDLSKASIGVVPDGAATVSPIAGSAPGSVTYPDAWPSADLTYTVSNAAVKESVLLKSPEAATSYLFTVRAGTKAQVSAGASSAAATLTTATDGSGALVPAGALAKYAALQAPVVLTKDGAPVEEAKASFEVVGTGQVRLSIDPAWLAEQPLSAYPITLDPTVKVDVDSDYSYKSDGFTCAGCGQQSGNSRDLIGGVNYDRYWRSLFHFNLSGLFGKGIYGTMIWAQKQSGAASAWQMDVHWANAMSFAGAAAGPALAYGAPGSGNWLTDAGLSATISSLIAQGNNAAYFGVVGCECAGQYSYQKYKFQLSITYASTPDAPSGANFSTPSFPCATTDPLPRINTKYDSAFGAYYSTPDGGSMKAGYVLTAVNDPNPPPSGNLLAENRDLTSGAAMGVLIPSSLPLKNGITYDMETYGWVPTNTVPAIGPRVHCRFIADTSKPATPVFVSSAVGTGSPTGLTGGIAAGGVVGQPVTFTFTAPYAPVAVRYSWDPLPAQTSRLPVSPCTTGVTDTTTAQSTAIGYACASGSGTVSVTLATVQRGTNPLYVEYINSAQTASDPALASQSPDQPLLVSSVADPVGGLVPLPGGSAAALANPSHLWSVPTGATTSVADGGNVTASGHAGSDSAASMSLASSVAVGSPASNPVGTAFAQPNSQAMAFSGPYVGTYRNSSSVATAGPSSALTMPYLTSTGFTGGAWVYPTAAASLPSHAVMSQEGTYNSGFILRTSSAATGDGVWEFCMADPASTSPTLACVDTASSVARNQWTFVAGIWDPVNQQIRISAYPAGTSSTPAPPSTAAVSAPPRASAAAGPLVIGRAQWAALGGDYDAFAGQIASPFVATGAMSTNQLSNLYTATSQ